MDKIRFLESNAYEFEIDHQLCSANTESTLLESNGTVPITGLAMKRCSEHEVRKHKKKWYDKSLGSRRKERDAWANLDQGVVSGRNKYNEWEETGTQVEQSGRRPRQYRAIRGSWTTGCFAWERDELQPWYPEPSVCWNTSRKRDINGIRSTIAVIKWNFPARQNSCSFTKRSKWEVLLVWNINPPLPKLQ